MPDYTQVIRFWFEEASPKQLFSQSEEFDETIRQKFSGIHQLAKAAELYHWRQEPLGRLAEIIVLDQFSRNLYRDSPEAFANDNMALALSQEAIACQAGQEMEPRFKAFLYMPFMHSESLFIHEQAVDLFSGPGLEMNLEFEIKHKVIIEKFGRYPHRNEVLGRISTPEEKEFLLNPGSGF